MPSNKASVERQTLRSRTVLSSSLFKDFPLSPNLEALIFMYFYFYFYFYRFYFYYEAVSGKAMAPHSSTLAWRIPWTVEPGRLQSMGSLRVGHD